VVTVLYVLTPCFIPLSDNEKMQVFASEEKQIRHENVRLQQKLAQEKEKRLALSRQLSESESRFV
jgi:coiled-coil domain-containing protein 6